VVQECEGDVRKWNIAGLWMSIFSVRHFILVVDEPGATEVVVPRTVRACQVVLLAVLAGVTSGAATSWTVVVVFGTLIPVIPVQSYSFGWMQPSARASDADGHVTDPCSLRQHWLPAQEPQS